MGAESLNSFPGELRAREIITSHFRIPSSNQVMLIFTRPILNVALAPPPVVLPQIDLIYPKSWCN
jgi:hypothetical protein